MHYNHSDGSGNVTALITSAGNLAAKYIYSGFGQVILSAGACSDANLYRFSSKEAHGQTRLTYFLYRYYDPEMQRWLNRDPLGEMGFERVRRYYSSSTVSDSNLYRYVRNGAGVDPFGLEVSAPPGKPPTKEPPRTGDPGDPCAGIALAMVHVLQELIDEGSSQNPVTLARLGELKRQWDANECGDDYAPEPKIVPPCEKKQPWWRSIWDFMQRIPLPPVIFILPGQAPPLPGEVIMAWAHVEDADPMGISFGRDSMA